MIARLDALLTVASGGEAAIPPVSLFETLVPGEGPLDARIVVIGESAGHEEVEEGRPFVGRSGKKLKGWMKAAGISPDRCRIDNVMPLFPPGGNMGNLPADQLAFWQEDCRKRVRALERAQVIVAVGNYALETFTGYREITKRRGSVYAWEGKKVVGVVHPAMVLRQKSFEQHCRRDWERVKLLTTPHITHHQYCGCAFRLKRTHITPFNTERQVLNGKIAEYLLRAQEDDSLLCIDIETPKVNGKRDILCVGFAFDAEESLTLAWNETTQPIIKMLCESPCMKLGHNFVSFDRWWLKRKGIDVQGKIYDTLTISHALNPASRHSLEFLQSVYTWEPWHKDQGHGHDITVIEKNYPGYYIYCGIDCNIPHELFKILWPQLEHRGLVSFYEQHYEALYDPILELMDQGVRINHEARQETLYELLQEAREARDTLGEINGSPLFTLTTKRDTEVYAALMRGNTDGLPYPPDLMQKSLETISKKTVSGAQLKTLLYEKMGLEAKYKRRSTGDITLTADSVTLRKLKLEHPYRLDVARVVDLAQKHNRAQKLASFLYPGTFDPEDGRFRFTLRLNTEASRFASSQAPDGNGKNSQNTPRDKRIRRIVLPEVGHILLEADLSQAEGRFCFVYTQDPELIRLARLRPSEFDQHNYIVSLLPKKKGTCFGFPLVDIPAKSEERQAAKSFMHAFQRNMQAQTAVDTMLRQNENYVYTIEDTELVLQTLQRALPAIPAWHALIRKEIRANKSLTSSWGHTWDVRYEEMKDDLFRRAYSWKMQRDCAGLTNIHGLIPLWNWLKKEHMQSRIMLQEHDSLVCSCSPDEAYDVAIFLKEHLEAPREYDGVELSIPVEYKIGKSWGECYEYGELPNRQTFEAQAQNVFTL